MLRIFVLGLTTALLVACGDEQVNAAVFGQRLFDSPKLSTSPVNVYSCGTCHGVTGPGVVRTRIDPGFNLHDSVHRPSWWGGEMTRLPDAINYCVVEFMGGRELGAADASTRQLFEYLADNSPTRPAPALPLTVVKLVTPLAELSGDRGRGSEAYARACQRCHGEPRTGKGRNSPRAGEIPDGTIAIFKERAREAVVEKVRHGKFFHIGGIMPLFPVEALSDQQLTDVLTYLGL